MPRSTSAAIWSCTLALAVASAQFPVALAQPGPDKATEAMLKEIEVAERRSEKIFARLRSIEEPPAPDPPKNFPDIMIGRNRVLIPDDDTPQRTLIVLYVTTIGVAIFGGHDTDSSRRRRLGVLLVNQIERSGRDPRMATLTLAGRGDIKRFFDRVERLRTQYAGTGVAAVDEEEFRRLKAEVRSLQALYKDGPFGDGSLYHKALRTIRRREH